jgi:hypothetical protein
MKGLRILKRIPTRSYGKYVLTILVVAWFGWWIANRTFRTKAESPILELALQAAGANRVELEKVLHHYLRHPADSLKYKAACFLIENMPYYSYPVSRQLEKYKTYYIWLHDIPNKSPQQLVDSIKQAFGPIDSIITKRDIETVDSAYLCNNIEWAFKAWQERPWGKRLSFDDFCEYILPYRIGDEPLTNWREAYYRKYSPLLDSLQHSNIPDKDNPLVVAEYLHDKVATQPYVFTTLAPYAFGHIGPEYVQTLTGSCKEVTDFGTYLLRALGIPCAIDFLPIRSGMNAGHFWLTTWDKNGEDYMSEFFGPFGKTHGNWWYRFDNSPKIYRHTFQIDRKLRREMTAYHEPLYSFWNLPTFRDVTREYAYYYQKELKIPATLIYKTKREGEIAYLCLSSRNEWIPVAWAPYHSDGMTFHNIKKGAVVRLATYENEKLQFITDPFYVDGLTNKTHTYNCRKRTRSMVLYAKFNVDEGDDLMFRNRLVGGVIEASNRPDFSTKDTLYLIQQRPHRLITTVRAWSHKKFRYFRYFGPPGQHCSISELRLYVQGTDSLLRGKPIGTPGCFQKDGSHEYPNVFDGSTTTCFDYLEPSGGWAGLDAGREVTISQIAYSPSNRDNYVCPDNEYELFYCDGEWKSAGRIKAMSDSLLYKAVPENALLLLHDYTRGKDERIFTYEKEGQSWK